MTIQTITTEAFDAAIGAGDLAVAKAKDLAGNLREFDAKSFWSKRQRQIQKNYRQLVQRGSKLRKQIRSSAPVQRAAEQTTAARRQVKAAATSVRKAVGESAEATKSAAKKVG